MSSALEQKLNWLEQEGHAGLLTQIQHGIEKEGLRVDGHRRLSTNPHPDALGSALTHDYITTDYSEALLEFITPVFDSSNEALDFLSDLHRYTYKHLDGEQIWPASMPCELPEEKDIPIARYGSSNIGKMKYVYRVGLEHRYGKIMQTIAGIHYNFSMPEAFWPIYQEYNPGSKSLKDFRSAAYFSLIRNFRRYSWLLMYLFGASPALCRSFFKGEAPNLDTLSEGTLYLPYATSLRMSDLGYSNKAQASLNICFNHLHTYANSLNRAIQTPYPPYEEIGVRVDGEYRQLSSNILQIENEYYSDIRPKRVTQSGEKPVQALISRGVEYIEVRNTDINPFLLLGIDQEQADFMDLFLISCLLMEEREISTEECDHIGENHQRIVTRGREPGLTLICNEQEKPLTDWGHELLDQVQITARLLDRISKTERYSNTVTVQRDKLNDSSLTPSARVLQQMTEQKLGYGEFVMQQAEQHKKILMDEPLSGLVESKLNAIRDNSLEKQRTIEASDTLDFDTFLSDYFAS
ncbi:MAG: glutamate--cysteine ligase [Neptuniibacter sp.]